MEKINKIVNIENGRIVYKKIRKKSVGIHINYGIFDEYKALNLM